MLNTDLNTPYSNLTPELILASLESVGYHCTGSFFALNSYENRVYQLEIEDSAPLIAKFYRPGRWNNESIIEEHQFALELVELEIPVVAPVIIKGDTLHHHEGYRFAIYPRQSGRILDLDNLEHLEWMGRFIGRLHAVSACRSFEHRGRLGVENQGYNAYNFLIANNFLPEYLKPKFCQTVETLLVSIEQQFKAIMPISYIRLHGDCHPGNVLWNEYGPHIVDLDDCLMGPAIQDIWMLLSGDELNRKGQLDRILGGYNEFYDFNPIETKLIESLRALRLLHYCAWLAKRWDDPTFPIHFPFFNTPHYWQELLTSLSFCQKEIE